MRFGFSRLQLLTLCRAAILPIWFVIWCPRSLIFLQSWRPTPRSRVIRRDLAKIPLLVEQPHANHRHA